MQDGRRNILIIFAIAVVLTVFYSFGSTVIFSMNTILSILFMIAIGYLLYTTYRNNESRIATIPAGPRLVLQAGCVAAVLVIVTGTLFPGWGVHTVSGALTFFILLGLSVGAIWWGWQRKAW